MSIKQIIAKDKYTVINFNGKCIVRINGTTPPEIIIPDVPPYEFGIDPVQGYTGNTATIRVVGEKSTRVVKSKQEAVNLSDGGDVMVINYFNQSSDKIATFEFIPYGSAYPKVVVNGSALPTVSIRPGMGYRITQTQVYEGN
jgi:hypothetical protein